MPFGEEELEPEKGHKSQGSEQEETREKRETSRRRGTLRK